jgi:hypothetical protein
MRNWPGGSRLGTAAAARVPVQQESSEGGVRLMPEQQVSRKRKASVSIEAETEKALDQEQRASFLQEREEYASSLERIIAKARESAASCSPYPSTPAVSQGPENSSFTSLGESITSTNVGYSSTTSSGFEASGNEMPGTTEGDQLSKCPTSSRGGGELTKRVALGVLDSNTRRSPRSKKGKNRRFDHSEWVL